jgi:hypothetical protein
MPKSKHRKGHKQKSAKRTERLNLEKERMKKMQRMFIEQYAEQIKKMQEEAANPVDESGIVEEPATINRVTSQESESESKEEQ